jgi:O-antigen/teichoic acid export membrane protein
MGEKVAKSSHSLWTKVKQGASLTRLRPFDTSTQEGRSKERYRRMTLTAIASIAGKGMTLLTKLISVPLVLGYLGTERFGLWVMIISMGTMLALADLGIGNGLLNAISEAYGKDDPGAARKYVSSAFFVLSATAVSLAAIFALIYPWVPWMRVFNVSSSQAVSEAGPALAVFAGCVLASVPLSVGRQTLIGYQEGFAANLWTSLGSVLGLGGVLLAIRLEAGLPWLVLAMGAGPALALFLNCVALFGLQRPWLLPRLKNVEISAAKRISQTGLLSNWVALLRAPDRGHDHLLFRQYCGCRDLRRG